MSELLFTKYILSAMMMSATARNTTDSAAELQIAPSQTLKVAPSGRKQSVWTPFALPSFILRNVGATSRLLPTSQPSEDARLVRRQRIVPREGCCMQKSSRSTLGKCKCKV